MTFRVPQEGDTRPQGAVRRVGVVLVLVQRIKPVKGFGGVMLVNGIDQPFRFRNS